eukprot:gene4122-5876_t
MESATDLLKYRVDVLQSSFLGDINLTNDTSSYELDLIMEHFPRTINDRIDAMSDKLIQFEKDVPNLKQCNELIGKLKPHLVQKRININRAETLAAELMAQKKKYFNAINELLVIEQLSPIVFGSRYYNVSQFLQRKLAEIEEIVQKLVQEVEEQTAEIDNILELYEKSMILYSEIAQNWDEKLTILENKK